MITIKQVKNNRIQIRGMREDWKGLNDKCYIKILPTLNGFDIQKYDKAPRERGKGIVKLTKTGRAYFATFTEKSLGFKLQKTVAGDLTSIGNNKWSLDPVFGGESSWTIPVNVPEPPKVNAGLAPRTLKQWLKNINTQISNGEMEATLEDGQIALWVKTRV